ncbi:protease pro-enzyme activation domain-containing protein [Dyella sp. 2HG41-7]|uniref:S53 family peptidase n=1 Tax=Dyella sp. 2HG41-7 TaxID=2883239 RepID=UPI001EEDA204|nr:protease pro-enzyme activation domain-containing protein [Dyella sp. 2HG41-7]
MKLKHSMLGASIALALIVAPATQANNASNILANLHTTEAPRITVVVNNNSVVPVSGTHMNINVAPSSGIPDTATMNHMQLILKPSAQRQAALKQLIAAQHNPQSPSFHQWITPDQYGQNFGVADADIATVTAWLTSQGFTVNNIYPNKTQIDFSGTAGQVRAAFHTQENLYTLRQTLGGATTSVTHLSNNSDISIPTALQGVVAGVMGLNDFHAQAFAQKQHVMHWNAAAKTYEPISAEDIHRQQVTQLVAQGGKFGGGVGGKAQTIAPIGTVGIRGLVPYDMNQMYDANALRQQGITGRGVTIAVVEDDDMVPADWTNFTQTFNLTQWGGTFAQVNPAPPSGTTNCLDPDAISGKQDDGTETLLDAEWSSALAPSANIVVAACSDVDANKNPMTSNAFGGVFIAATNEINLTTGRPNIISASYGYGEYFTDSASKSGIDAMWAQADSEGISVFVSTGDSGSNPSFNGAVINGEGGNTAVDANAFATSPNDTGVGGTDTADVLDGTTSKYFASTTQAYGGSALGYVPEIPWNESCGNGIAAAALGYTPLAFCQAYLQWDQSGYYVTSEAGSGGRSGIDAKPAWQGGVYDAAPDGMRDLPDVSLFAGSYGGHTWAIICTAADHCALNSSGQPTTGNVALEGGTSLSAPMFAGIQALIDQAMGSNGTPANQGNAAPTLYALAQQEYGTSTTPNNAQLSTCASNDTGSYANNGCVFHNIVRGDISTQCYQPSNFAFVTYNCYFYGTIEYGQIQVGLTSNNLMPTDYTGTDRAYTSRPGWSLASGLGSVDAANLVAAWKKYAASRP